MLFPRYDHHLYYFKHPFVLRVINDLDFHHNYLWHLNFIHYHLIGIIHLDPFGLQLSLPPRPRRPHFGLLLRRRILLDILLRRTLLNYSKYRQYYYLWLIFDFIHFHFCYPEKMDYPFDQNAYHYSDCLLHRTDPPNCPHNHWHYVVNHRHTRTANDLLIIMNWKSNL